MRSIQVPRQKIYPASDLEESLGGPITGHCSPWPLPLTELCTYEVHIPGLARRRSIFETEPQGSKQVGPHLPLSIIKTGRGMEKKKRSMVFGIWYLNKTNRLCIQRLRIPNNQNKARPKQTLSLTLYNPFMDVILPPLPSHAGAAAAAAAAATASDTP
ncbi:hypothetical protein VTI74DRAFT_8616 [Chaetomium olivicolor]